jgi:uncharacterized glyoxalase superfamily protein PhnB
VTSIQPELWVENARRALGFYRAAFGATVLHLVGEGDDIVAQLASVTQPSGWRRCPRR